MKYYYLLIISALLISCSKNDNEPDDAMTALIPDRAFREFCIKMFDTNGDGVLSEEEFQAVDRIECYPTLLDPETGEPVYISNSIKSLRGIEHFTNLEYINFQAIDVAELDLSRNTRLKEVKLIYNGLKSLNVKNIPGLLKLNITSGLLTKLDISENIMLQELYCGQNRLTELYINKNLDLRVLETLESLNLRTIYVPADFDPETTELEYYIDDWTGFTPIR